MRRLRMDHSLQPAVGCVCAGESQVIKPQILRRYVTFTVEGLLGIGKNDGEFAKNSA